MGDKTTMSLPTMILAKERPDQLRDMLKSMEGKVDDKDIIIVDNASSDIRMGAFLYGLEGRYSVRRCLENNGFRSLNVILSELDSDFFAISDPDIIFNKNLPEDWEDLLIEAMIHTNAPKIGFALDTSYLSDSKAHNYIKICEQGALIKKVVLRGLNDDAWFSFLDTTYAIYRKDTYRTWNDKHCFDDGIMLSTGHITQDAYNAKYGKYPIRVGGRFLAKHTGWTMIEDYPEDTRYYTSNCNIDLASTTKMFKGMGVL